MVLSFFAFFWLNSKIEDDFVAVSVYTKQEDHIFTKQYTGKNVLQVWKISGLNEKKEQIENVQSQFAFGIVNEEGYVAGYKNCSLFYFFFLFFVFKFLFFLVFFASFEFKILIFIFLKFSTCYCFIPSKNLTK